ncbi:hypothetical protein MPSEU_000996100 [Mayamaea pseudoterrestris]|nr:hypothetical protein MPSEU_000996100 [Mayamaea pseudoterrestris]
MLLLTAIDESITKQFLGVGSKGFVKASKSFMKPNYATPPSSPVSVLPSCVPGYSQMEQKRSGVTWSDEFGESLVELRTIPRRERSRSSDAKKLIILLLSPSHRKYEFICCEYQVSNSKDVNDNAKITVKDVLEQLPAMASHDLLRRQRYIALCRRDNTELINALSMQSYGLNSFEMLWAVPKHHKSKQLAPMVLRVLSNKGLLKALRYSPAHWEVHKLRVPPAKKQASDIFDMLNIKRIPNDGDGGMTCPTSDNNDDDDDDDDNINNSKNSGIDEGWTKETYLLRASPSPKPESFCVLPSFMSFLHRKTFSVTGHTLFWKSWVAKTRTNMSWERENLLVTLFTKTEFLQRKSLLDRKSKSQRESGRHSDKFLEERFFI